VEAGGTERYLWDYLVHHYHYLRRPKLVGEHLKQLVYLDEQVVGCLGECRMEERAAGAVDWLECGAKAHPAPSPDQQRAFSHPALGAVEHLASKVLGMSVRGLSRAWQARYGHPVVLAETFVDLSRFAGTCYRAANWHYLGSTQGHAKRGNAAQAVPAQLALWEKAERWERLEAQTAPEQRPVEPTTPSGMTPVYLKPRARGRRKRPGRKAGHAGARRAHRLTRCPECGGAVGASLRQHRRLIEDIPKVTPKVAEHITHGHWCRRCKKIVTPKMTGALPGATLGLRFVVYTAWLHYCIGMSVGNCVKNANVSPGFPVSPGGLTLGWKNLAWLLAPHYQDIGKKVRESAVLHADETGWRSTASPFGCGRSPRNSIATTLSIGAAAQGL